METNQANTPQQSPITITDLLKRQLAEWQELKTKLTSLHAQFPSHEVYLDLMYCEAKIVQLEDDLAMLGNDKRLTIN